MSDNGNAETQPAGEVITIVLTRKPWHVHIAGHGMEAALCKAALLAAVDEVDAQIRLARVVQLQQQQAENARVAAILDKARPGMR